MVNPRGTVLLLASLAFLAGSACLPSLDGARWRCTDGSPCPDAAASGDPGPDLASPDAGHDGTDLSDPDTGDGATSDLADAGDDTTLDLPDALACGDEGCCYPGLRRCEGAKVMECVDGAWTRVVEDCAPETTGRVCHLGTCINLCEFQQKFPTHEGCGFWAIDMDQFYDSGNPDQNSRTSQYAIVVSNGNPDWKAVATVEDPAGKVQTVDVGPGASVPILLSPAFGLEGSLLGRRAYRLTSTLPVVAVQFNPLENVGVYSNDASLLLPDHVLGRRYRVLTWPTLGGQNEAGQALASNFAVVGTGTGTVQVSVTVSAAVQAGSGVPAMQAGSTATFALGPFEVLNFEAGKPFDDLTGSIVEATGPVAVFAGHVCAMAPLSRCSAGKCSYDPGKTCTVDGDCPSIAACDHLEEQLPPVRAWGKTVVIAKTWPRGKAPDIVRVLAAEDATHVTVTGAAIEVPVLAEGKFHEFEITNAVVVTADRPILVGQYLEGQDAPGSAHSSCFDETASKPCGDPGPQPSNCTCHQEGQMVTGQACKDDRDCSPDDANIGDPSFLVVPPVEQHQAEYRFLVPSKYRYSYVSVVAPQGTEVSIDGWPVDTKGFVPIAGTSWATARFPVVPGAHVLTCSQKAGMMVYGWDRYVSYGYPGGMNVKILQAETAPVPPSVGSTAKGPFPGPAPLTRSRSSP